MKPWLEPPEISIPAGLLSAAGGRVLVAQRLARLGLSDSARARAFLDPACYSPADPFDLPGMPAIAGRLERAIRLGEPVCVWGDFDVDGQTATTILVTALRELGAQVSFHIPVRAVESHGVNLPRLQQVIDAGARLVLTCDTGITAHAAAEYAKTRAVDFLITDHHALPPELPAATAIVNPRLLPEDHPLATLSGAGAAYKLAEALYRQAGRPAGAAEMRDLVALGLVADVADLRGESRYLVQLGLDALRQNRRLGLRALLEAANLPSANLTEEHIGFTIAPRLNALGRLSDANLAVEFLSASNPARAAVIAQQLEGLNAERQFKTRQIFQSALGMIQADPSLLEFSALVLSAPAWEAGVIGIVASRLVERFEKPVVLLSSPPGAPARGSARSIAGVDVTAAIAACRNILNGFGGHPMAAGLSLDPARIPEFRQALARAVNAQQGETPLLPALQIDAYLSLPDATLELAEQLESLAPFGSGNPPLTFAARGLTLQRASPIGRNGEHLALSVAGESGEARRVLWWQAGSDPLPSDLQSGRFDLAFRLRATTFNGQRDAQLEFVDFRPLDEPAIALHTPKIELLDLRGEPDPRSALDDLLARFPSAGVWCEGEARRLLSQAGLIPLSRLELQTCETLVIWTAPPGRLELQSALERARPTRVALFALDPGAGDLDGFLKRLAGLVKYALGHNGGQVNLPVLAAALASRPSAARLGVEWLAARGWIEVMEDDGESIMLVQGKGQEVSLRMRSTVEDLRKLLSEIEAYRAYLLLAEASLMLK